MKELKGIDEKTVVHCTTLELDNQVREIAGKAGKEWLRGDLISERSAWDHYESNTCIEILNGTFDNLEYYQERGYKILSAEEFIFLNSDSNIMTIIGYKAPYDIAHGFSKGFIVKINDKVDNRYPAYSEIPENGKMWFSAEWVERDWEPVYEEEPKKGIKSGWVILCLCNYDCNVSKPFQTREEAGQWVRANAEEGKYYSYLEVDYV